MIDGSGRLLKSGQASLISTTLSHQLQVASSSDANAILLVEHQMILVTNIVRSR